MSPEEIKVIEERIKKPMSDADLERYTGIKPEEIIKYCELKNYEKIQDLLPTDKSFKIILIEEKYNNGHWVAVTRLFDTITYFNSYGSAPDTDWKFISRMIRTILGEGTNEMTRLMKSAETEDFHTEWNHTRFQRLSAQVQTCGRWCALFVELVKMGYTLKEFTDFVKNKSIEMRKPYDFVVAYYIK